MDKGIIAFSKEFTNILKILKGALENFFLENHKSIQIQINHKDTSQIKYFVNMGRYVIEGIETPDKIEGFTEDFVTNMSIEILKNYADTDKDKQLKLVIRNEKVYVYSDGFQYLLSETAPPELIDLPYVDAIPYSEKTTELYKSLFDKACQKENLITFKNNLMYEKLTDHLFHLEKIEIPNHSCIYKDLKLITELVKDDELSFNTAPTYNLFKTKTKNIWVMKYSLDTISDTPFKKRDLLVKSPKTNIINITTLDIPEIKKIVHALSITGNKVFGIQIGNETLLSGIKSSGYKLTSESQMSVTKQHFIFTKKEIDIIIKECSKDKEKKGKLKIVAGKDFLIFGNKFLFLAKGDNDE